MSPIDPIEVQKFLSKVPFSDDVDLKKIFPNCWRTNISAGIKVLIELGNLCTDPAMKVWFFKQAGIDAAHFLQCAEFVFQEELANQTGECWMALMGEEKLAGTSDTQ